MTYHLKTIVGSRRKLLISLGSVLTLLILLVLAFSGAKSISITPVVPATSQTEISQGYADRPFYDYQFDYCIQHPNLKIPADCYSTYLNQKIIDVLTGQKFIVNGETHTYFESDYYSNIEIFGDLEEALLNRKKIYFMYISFGPGRGYGSYTDYHLPKGYQIIDVALEYNPITDEKLSSTNFFDPIYATSLKKVATLARNESELELKDNPGFYITQATPSYVKALNNRLIFFERQDINDTSRSPGPCYSYLKHYPIFYVDLEDGSIKNYSLSQSEIDEENTKSNECEKKL